MARYIPEAVYGIHYDRKEEHIVEILCLQEQEPEQESPKINKLQFSSSIFTPHSIQQDGMK